MSDTVKTVGSGATNFSSIINITISAKIEKSNDISQINCQTWYKLIPDLFNKTTNCTMTPRATAEWQWQLKPQRFKPEGM